MSNKLISTLLPVGLFILSFGAINIAVADQDHWYVEGGIGLSIPKIKNDHQAEENADYTVSKINRSTSFTFAVGHTWSFDKLHYSLGLEYGQSTSSTVEGKVIADGKPNPDSSYKYKTSHKTLMIQNKLNFKLNEKIMPYVAIGLGFSRNSFSDYQERGLIEFPRTTPDYASAITTSFAYSLGTGVDYAINEQVWFGVGYRYNDFGQIKSGLSNAANLNSRYQGKLSSHDIRITLRHLY